MTAISAASGPTSFGQTSNPDDDYAPWNHTTSGHNEIKETSMNHSFDEYEANSSPHIMSSMHNGTSYPDQQPTDSFAPRESRSNSRAAAPQPRTKRAMDGTILTYDDENSKWIHRDKLAKIENEELQAAGIILPRPRTQSRPRRDRSQDKSSSRRRGTTDSAEQQHRPRSRKNSDLGHERTPELEVPAWDFRLPEEIAEDPGEYFVTNGSGRGTRIPVAKQSPVPIPVDYIDRNAPMQRTSSFALLDEEASISYPKARSRSNSIAKVLDDPPKPLVTKRSVTDGSPKKTTTAPRKTSAPTKSTTQSRPKTRSGTTARSSSATRPTTRSGDASTRAPEGDPPWMISAYQPDPRLPPEQQLLPTVAKRLQQEKWEQEGAFGSVYDKEFRPLNKDNFARPPEVEKTQEPEERTQDEWPLKPELTLTRVPTPSRPGTSSYSTMPKIQDAPAMSPLGSPRSMHPLQPQIDAAVRIPEPPEQEKPVEKPKKSGCGCCVVM